MSKVPQTLSDETVEALNALIAESERFRDWNSVQIQTLLRTVEKLQKVDARDAFVRFGSIAAICGEVDRFLEYSRKALLLPGELDTKPEFYASLANAGLYRKAHEIGVWLLDPKRGFFPQIWRRAVSMGQVLAVWERLSDARKTFPDLSDVDFALLESAAALMRDRELTDRDIVSVFDLMGEVQRAHRIMFSGTLISTLRVMRPPEDPPYLFFAISLNASVSEVHSMNRELAKLVVQELSQGVFPQGLVATFTKAQPVELRVAA